MTIIPIKYVTACVEYAEQSLLIHQIQKKVYESMRVPIECMESYNALRKPNPCNFKFDLDPVWVNFEYIKSVNEMTRILRLQKASLHDF